MKIILIIIYVEHRYESDKIQNGKPVVAYQRLNVSRTVEESNNLIDLKIEVLAASGNFTSSVREKVVQSYL